MLETVPFTRSFPGVNLQRHTTDIRLGMTLELATSFGAALTAYLVGYIKRTAPEVLFATFLLYGTITILRKGGKPEDEQNELILAPSGEGVVIPAYGPKRYGLGMSACLVAGGLSGLLGIGGGPIKVPVMYLFMGVPLIVATASSNFMMGATAAAGSLVYYRRGDILPIVAAPLAVGVFIGSLSGARLAPRVPSKWIGFLLVSIMLYLSLHMFVHILGEIL